MNADDLVNGRTGIAAAAFLAAVGLGLTSAQTPTMAAPVSGMSEIAKLAAAGGVDALQQMLDARSPGLRTPGALTQTKARRIGSLKEAFGPKERVLGKGRTRPPVPGSNVPAVAYETGRFNGPGPYTPAGPATLPWGDVAVADLGPLPPATGPYPIFGGGATPIIVTGGGGGGGSGGGGSSGGGGGGGTPGVVSSVPEPATWLSLLIGFFAIGFGLRSAAARQPSRPLSRRAFQ
jgi:hypothetical protein